MQKIGLPSPALILVAALFTGAASAEPEPESVSGHHHHHQKTLNPFTADYSLAKKGMTLGKIRLSLKKEGNDWRYETHAEASGLAAMFSNDTITESTLFKIDRDGLRPLHYRYLRSGEKHGKDLQTGFDWGKATATVTDRGQSTTVELKDGTLNEHAVTVALILALKSGFSEKTYTVLDETRLEPQTYTCAGEETVKVPAGEFNAVKVVRTHGSRKTIGWYAPMQNYLPVKIQSFKNGKLQSEMELLPVRK
jgi:hypothetical protein